MTQGPPTRGNQGLAEGTVQVFCLAVPEGFGALPMRAERAARVLMTRELERFDRYAVQHRRNDLVLSRILLTVILDRLGLASSGPWMIEPDGNGKPHAVSPDGPAPFHLSTSDTAGLIAWAISLHGPLGCDAELIREDKDEIAARHFAPAEVAGYRALGGIAKRHRFYEIWTLKEAVMKADGRGLAIPLDSFLFRFDASPSGPGPALEVARPEPGPEPGPWRFLSYRPLPSHQMAVAVLTPAPVAFDCHLLRLAACDADLDLPWRFVFATDPDRKGGATEFGSYDPAAAAGGPGSGTIR